MKNNSYPIRTRDHKKVINNSFHLDATINCMPKQGANAFDTYVCKPVYAHTILTRSWGKTRLGSIKPIQFWPEYSCQNQENSHLAYPDKAKPANGHCHNKRLSTSLANRRTQQANADPAAAPKPSKHTAKHLYTTPKQNSPATSKKAGQREMAGYFSFQNRFRFFS